MKIIPAPQEISNPIYRAELQINPEAIDQNLSAQKSLTHQDLLDLEGDLVEVGAPQWWDLSDLASSQRINPAPEIQSALQTHDFWIIQFVLSIAPVKDNHIEWVRFRVRLEGEQKSGSPLACSLFPGRIRQGKSVIRTAGIGDDFKFHTNSGSEKKCLIRVGLEDDNSIEITSAGLSSSAPSWDFRGYDIRGSMVTYAVIQKLKESTLQAEFGFNAQLQTSKGELFATASKQLLGGKMYQF